MIDDQEFKRLVLRLLLAIYWCASGREPIDNHRDVIAEVKRVIR